VLLHLGFTACVLLATVLCFSPLRILFPGSGAALALNRHRRLVGVSAFIYGVLHFTMHLLYEGGFGVLATDITTPFMVIGMATLAILTALAATSSNLAIRLMGGRNWKRLHRLAYVAAGLAAWHQAEARKLFPMQVVWIFGPVALLQAARVWRNLSRRKSGA
jgi:sulfoxide reductase heme-binding subunit YedZ